MEQFKSQDLNKLASGLSNLYPENVFFKNLRSAIAQYPSLITDDFLSKGQIESKRWLVKELVNLSLNLGNVYLTPGWYGLLAQFLTEQKLDYGFIRSFDIDPRSVEISDLLNRNLLIDGWKFKATCQDIFNINYAEHAYTTVKNGNVTIPLIEVPDTIINTACEHFDYLKWLKLIPSNKLLVLQNNDFSSCKEHIYCVTSLEEFKINCNLKEYYYTGVLKLDNYNRYMLIGRK